MNLNDLLRRKGIDPQHVLVLRHTPSEIELRKLIPWLALEKPDLFNAYQQTQKKRVENRMTRAQYVAAFIGHEPRKALFIGLYSNKGSTLITREQFDETPDFIELKKYGMKGFDESDSPSCLRFDLELTDFYAQWKGKLIIRWPQPDKGRSPWDRWAHEWGNEMPILAILEESALEKAMPDWTEINLKWEELKLLPASWKAKLLEWRGIYYIFDTSDSKGYVGAAYGEYNLLGRWLNYAVSGHGGNKLLLERDPQNFQFTILQIVAHDLEKSAVEQLEGSWKRRLHTRNPYGLNNN